MGSNGKQWEVAAVNSPTTNLWPVVLAVVEGHHHPSLPPARPREGLDLLADVEPNSTLELLLEGDHLPVVQQAVVQLGVREANRGREERGVLMMLAMLSATESVSSSFRWFSVDFPLDFPSGFPLVFCELSPIDSPAHESSPRPYRCR